MTWAWMRVPRVSRTRYMGEPALLELVGEFGQQRGHPAKTVRKMPAGLGDGRAAASGGWPGRVRQPRIPDR